MKLLENTLKETKIAYSVNSPGDEYQDLIVLITEHDRCYIEMTVLKPCCWWSDDNHKNVAVQYITSGKIKFDLCSHFYYTGQDTFVEKYPDSYYHICGEGSYLTMIITQCAILHVAKELIEKNGGKFNCGDKFVETLSKFMEIFEKEYEVTEIDLKEWNIVKFVSE